MNPHEHFYEVWQKYPDGREILLARYITLSAAEAAAEAARWAITIRVVES